MPEPIDKALYERIKKKVKSQVKVWPSAYASGMLVKQYKAAGGRYKGSKPNKSSKNAKGIGRWFEEQWIDVCKLPRIVPCGRKKSDMKNYPYCRPRKRVNKNTPKLANELTKDQIKKRCAKKKKNPKSRIMPKKSTRKPRKSTRKPRKSTRKPKTKNGKILNPKTGRYVSKSGKLGKQILSRKR